MQRAGRRVRPRGLTHLSEKKWLCAVLFQRCFIHLSGGSLRVSPLKHEEPQTVSCNLCMRCKRSNADEFVGEKDGTAH